MSENSPVGSAKSQGVIKQEEKAGKEIFIDGRNTFPDCHHQNTKDCHDIGSNHGRRGKEKLAEKVSHIDQGCRQWTVTEADNQGYIREQTYANGIVELLHENPIGYDSFLMVSAIFFIGADTETASGANDCDEATEENGPESNFPPFWIMDNWVNQIKRWQNAVFNNRTIS